MTFRNMLTHLNTRANAELAFDVGYLTTMRDKHSFNALTALSSVAHHLTLDHAGEDNRCESIRAMLTTFNASVDFEEAYARAIDMMPLAMTLEWHGIYCRDFDRDGYCGHGLCVLESID